MLNIKIRQAIKIIRKLIKRCNNEENRFMMKKEIINLQNYSRGNRKQKLKIKFKN